ncbi:MAG: stage 0 sporulation protein, partial [Clostridiales bacterium]
MIRIVGIRFKKTGKIYYFHPLNLELAVNDQVIVETARGLEFGIVVLGAKNVQEVEIVNPLKEVIRKATPEDIARNQANIEAEKV